VASNPTYAKPPMVETVIGVQFPEISGFRAAHFGLYWDTIRKDFPTATDQPRLEPNRERFPRLPAIPVPRFQIMQRTPADRVWFTAESAAELIQLQPDRFLFNWRRRGRNGEYPTYKSNSETFFKEFARFREFCIAQKLDEPVPELCEVTYVNHIEPEEDESAIDLAGKVFSGLRWKTSEGFLPTPESLTFNRAFVIAHNEKPIGRLYAEASIAMRRQGPGPREFVLFNLTARVIHRADEWQELADSVQHAHDWVVRGFADLTDPQIQKERWERKA